jgi:hypothetical protein
MSSITSITLNSQCPRPRWNILTRLPTNRERILEELTGRVYYVGGSYEGYFEGNSWINNASDIYEEPRAH